MNDTVGTLLDLAAKNPDLPIVPMVDRDVVPDNGYTWWLGRIGDVRIGKYTTTDDAVVVYDDGDLQDTYYVIFGTDDVDDDEAREKLSEVKWIEAIIIYIELPE